jgi:ATP/maltotriose-dependent transcriptional regulator MalT
VAKDTRHDGDELVAQPLAEARRHFDAKRWSDACDAFAQADAASPLGVAELERYYTAAALMAKDADLLDLSERLHRDHANAGNLDAAARWAFWTGFRLFALGEQARASGWMARAERVIAQGGKESVVTGYLMLPAIRRHLATGDHDAALETSKSAISVGERFAEPDLVMYARCTQGKALVLQGQVEEGLRLLDEVMVSVLAGELSPLMTGLVYCAVIDTCHQAYALNRAREWTRAFSGWCDAQHQVPAFAGTCLVHRSEILQLGGEWTEAMEEARRAARNSPNRIRPITAGALYQEAEIHRLRGELALAEDAYRRVNELGRDPQPGLALLRLAQGKVEAADAAVRRALAASEAPLDRARLLPAYVEILLAAGDPDAARSAASELLQIARGFGGDVLSAMASQARGLVELAAGDAQAALPCLRRAFEVWESVGAPHAAARLRVWLARACRALGDDEGARLELTAASRVFEQLGAAPDLAAVRAAESTAAAPKEHGLTAREIEVLRLLATGKTNKAISQELFLSEKTVDRHVSNIFVKTGVTSRAAATAFAYEHGLVRPGRGSNG